MSRAPCKADGCEKLSHANGYCKTHYNRVRRTGSTEATRNWNPGAQCAVDECKKPVHANGYCNTHDMRVRRHGEAGSAESLAYTRHSKYLGIACVVDGCERQAKALGWCPMHYHRWKRTGDPVGKWGAEPRRSRGFIDANGYKRIVPVVGKGYRYEHVVVMEQILGRRLYPFENVHHKRPGSRADNRPENLELWVTHQPNGWRVEDMVTFVVDYYPDLVRKQLATT